MSCGGYRVLVNHNGKTQPAIAYRNPPTRSGFPLTAFAGTGFAGITFMLGAREEELRPSGFNTAAVILRIPHEILGCVR